MKRKKNEQIKHIDIKLNNKKTLYFIYTVHGYYFFCCIKY